MKVAPRLNALIIGRSYQLSWALPSLLARANFHTDVITSDPLLKHCRFVREYNYVLPCESLIPTIAQKIKRGYDWIIVTEDGLLRDIVDSSLSVEDKCKVLPVLREENFGHLFSKIGLSQALESSAVTIPAFGIAHQKEEALQEAERIGYPVLFKKDASGAGWGVVECKDPSDVQAIAADFFERPVLVQKKIEGVELDVSAIYLQGDLVHFSYSKPERTCGNRFGISCLRTYRPISHVEPALFEELAHIGKALGANGFTNISCIEQADGTRFYFEVDMRPNVWVDFPRYLGENPSLRIQEWFSHRKKLTQPPAPSLKQPSQLLLPYFLRLKIEELFVNRYSVWRYIPKEDLNFTLRVLLFSSLIEKGKRKLVSLLKQIIPEKYHPFLRRMKNKALVRKVLY